MTTICNNLVVFLLFISLCACNARKLAVFDKELTGSGLLGNKGIEKSSVLVNTSDPSKFWSNEVDLTRKIVNRGTKKVQDQHYSYDKSSNIENKPSSVAKSLVKTQMGSSSSSSSSSLSSTGSQRETLVSVSWKLSHQKKSKQPWIDLDYSPPKTHPPVHN